MLITVCASSGSNHSVLFAQRPQDILQLLLDAELPENGNTPVESTPIETQPTKDQPSHGMEKIVNFGAKKLTIEVGCKIY